MEEDVRVELRVRDLISDRASGRVPPARRDQFGCLLMHDGVVAHAPAQHQHLPCCVGQRPVDRGLMRLLDLLA
jgi:hypothetical protein